MLPTIRQRLIIAASLMLGSLPMLAVSDWLVAGDGSSGISLTSAGIGVIGATLIVAAAGVPVLALGLIVSAMGNPLSGVFTVSGALCVLAACGGPIDGWLRRSDLPGDYAMLLLEVLIWQAGVVVMLMVIQKLRSPLRIRLPALAFRDHLGVDTQMSFPEAKAIGAGLLCAACSGTLCMTLFVNRLTDGGQVIGSLIMAFGIGGFATQLIWPQTNPVGVLMGPAVVASVAYGYVTTQYADANHMMELWFANQIPGPALALPIHYASAALAGCSAGVGLAQTFDAVKTQAAPSTTGA